MTKLVQTTFKPPYKDGFRTRFRQHRYLMESFCASYDPIPDLELDAPLVVKAIITEENMSRYQQDNGGKTAKIEHKELKDLCGGIEYSVTDYSIID